MKESRFNSSKVIFLLLIALICLGSRCNKSLETCENFVKDSIMFKNFEFEEIKSVKIQYIDKDSVKCEKIIIHDRSRYNTNSKTIFSNEDFLFKKHTKYVIILKGYKYDLVIDSIGIHDQNTMLQENQICGIKSYKINSTFYKLNEILIDKNNFQLTED